MHVLITEISQKQFFNKKIRSSFQTVEDTIRKRDLTGLALSSVMSHRDKIPDADKYKPDLMQLPSFESVSKCILAETPRSGALCSE